MLTDPSRLVDTMVLPSGLNSSQIGFDARVPLDSRVAPVRTSRSWMPSSSPIAAVRPSGLMARARYPSAISTVLVLSRLSRSHQVSVPRVEVVTSERPSGVSAMLGSVHHCESHRPVKPSGSIRAPSGRSVAASRTVIQLLASALDSTTTSLEPSPVNAMRVASAVPRLSFASCFRVRASSRRTCPPPPTASVFPSELYERSRIEEAKAVEGDDREPASVGTDCERPTQPHLDARDALPVQDPHHRPRAHEVGKQVAARLRRFVDRDRLAGEQEREVEVLLHLRMGSEALGELGGLGLAGLAALDDGEDPAGDSGGE